MKNVTVVNGRTSTKSTLQTDATTWGVLKQQLIDSGISMNNMVAAVRETYNTLDMSEAILPETDFTIFLLAQQQKGGIDTNSLFTLAKSVDGICDDLQNAQEAIGGIVTTGKAFAAAATSFGTVMQDANEKITIMQDAVGRLLGSSVVPLISVSPAAPLPLPSIPIQAAEKIKKEPAEKVKKAPKNGDPSNKEIEQMKAEAKRLGLKVVCKTGKNHPNYAKEYKKAYDKAKLPEQPAKLPKSQDIPSPGVQTREQREKADDDLMAELKAMQRKFPK